MSELGKDFDPTKIKDLLATIGNFALGIGKTLRPDDLSDSDYNRGGAQAQSDPSNPDSELMICDDRIHGYSASLKEDEESDLSD